MSPTPDEYLDGGSTEEEQENIQPENIQLSGAQDAQQRARIGQWLILLLAALIATQYVCVFFLEWNSTKKIENLMSVFNASLPVVSGLVGSAVTYYFTRRNGSGNP